MKQTSPKTSPTRQGITRMTRKRPPLAVFHVEPAGERWVRFPPASANPGAVFNAHAGLGPSPETSCGTQRRFRHAGVAPKVAPLPLDNRPAVLYIRTMEIREADLGRWAETSEYVKAAVAEDAAIGRDEGTCVLGAGIAVRVIRKRARYPRTRILIDAPFQGNVGSRKACERGLALLRAAGLDAFWHDGRMD